MKKKPAPKATSSADPVSQDNAPFPTEPPNSEKTDSTDGTGASTSESSATTRTTPFPAESKETEEDRSKDNAETATATPIASSATLSTAEDRNENVGNDRKPKKSNRPTDATILANLPLAREKPGETRPQCWERIRREGRAAGLSRQGAYERATREIDRLFPPAEPTEPEPVIAEEPPAEPEYLPTVGKYPEIAVSPAPAADDGSVSGLSTLPPGWPELPANAQLQVEIAWVTANRLRVRSGTGVDLSKALSPAPSYSALSWLETSILFPAKFADISVKATADNDSEKEFVKREKLAIEEIRSILSEMLEADD